MDNYQSHYENSARFADEVLLASLENDREIYLVSDFIPDYMSRVISELTEDDELTDGYLNLTFFIRGDLGLKSKGISQFFSFLRRDKNDQQVAEIVEGFLSLLESGTLRLSLAYSESNRRLVKGAIGLVVDRSTDQYIAFADPKAGHHKSPIRLFDSWSDDEEFFVANEVFDQVRSIVSGNKSAMQLVSGSELLSWLEYIEQWFVENPPKGDEILEPDPDPDPSEGENDEDAEFLEFLLGFDELVEQDSFDWISPAEEYEIDLAAFSDFGVTVSVHEAVNGHIPPLPYPLSEFVGPAPATCICGQRFIRADGCSRIIW